MNYKTACYKSAEVAHKTEEYAYVVYDGEDSGYQPATEEDMETFFYGLEPVIAFDPCGDVAD